MRFTKIDGKMGAGGARGEIFFAQFSKSLQVVHSDTKTERKVAVVSDLWQHWLLTVLGRVQGQNGNIEKVLRSIF